MADEQLSELFARIHAGLRRSLQKGALLSEPSMRELHDRLLALQARDLTRRPLRETRFVVIDTETTGLRAYAGDEICSISLIEMQGLSLTGHEFNTLINPGRPIPAESSMIHHITDRDVRDAPVIEEVLLQVADFICDSVLVGHHVGFDIRFLNKTLRKQLLCHLKHPWIDTMLLYLQHTGQVGHYSLEEVAMHCRVEIVERHTARGDAVATAQVFARLAEQLTDHASPLQTLIDSQHQLGHF